MAQPNDAGLGGGKLSADQRAKMEALRQAMKAKAAQYTAPKVKPKSATSSSAYDPLSSANTGQPAAKKVGATIAPTAEEAQRERQRRPAPAAPARPAIPTVAARPSATSSQAYDPLSSANTGSRYPSTSSGTAAQPEPPAATQRLDIPSRGYNFTDASYTGATPAQRSQEIDWAQMAAQATAQANALRQAQGPTPAEPARPIVSRVQAQEFAPLTDPARPFPPPPDFSKPANVERWTQQPAQPAQTFPAPDGTTFDWRKAADPTGAYTPPDTIVGPQQYIADRDLYRRYGVPGRSTGDAVVDYERMAQEEIARQKEAAQYAAMGLPTTYIPMSEQELQAIRDKTPWTNEIFATGSRAADAAFWGLNKAMSTLRIPFTERTDAQGNPIPDTALNPGGGLNVMVDALSRAAAIGAAGNTFASQLQFGRDPATIRSAEQQVNELVAAAAPEMTANIEALRDVNLAIASASVPGAPQPGTGPEQGPQPEPASTFYDWYAEVKRNHGIVPIGPKTLDQAIVVAQRDPNYMSPMSIDGINTAISDINRQAQLDLQMARRLAQVRPMTYGEWSAQAPNFFDALAAMGIVDGQGVPYAEMVTVIASSGAEAQTRVLENFEMKSELPKIREVRDQLLWSNTDEGMSAALALSSLILKLETTPYSGLVDLETNLQMELLDNFLLDPLNFFDLPLGAVANANLAGKTAKAMTGLRTLDNADELGTLSKVFQDAYRPWLEGGRVGELAFPADLPADLLKLLPTANDLRQPGNFFARQLARTPETQVHISTNNLWVAMANVLNGVDNADDAIFLLRTLSDTPQEMIKGVTGLTSPAFVKIADADGIVRWGPGVISNPTLVKEMPIFQAGTARVLERMEKARDAAMEAAKKAGTFYDGSQQRVNPLELMVNLHAEWERAARQLRGIVPLDPPTGATKLNLHDLANGTAQVEWLDDTGKVVKQFPAQPIETARTQLATLQDALKTATENPLHMGLRVSAEIQRHIMSDMWLNLRPAHWVRNAAAFTVALNADGLYSFKSIPEIFEDMGKKVIAGRANYRMAEGSSGAGALGETSGTSYLRKWWPNKNPLAWLAEKGAKQWTGYGQILNSIPIAEQAGYAHALDRGFTRIFGGEWATAAKQELGPLIQSWNVDPTVAKAILDKIVETGKLGSKADVAQVARQITHGAAEPFSLRNLKIADEVIPVEPHKEIVNIVNTLGRTTPGQAPETVQEAIQRASDEIKDVFHRLRTRPGAMLERDMPQPTGEQVFNATDEAAEYVDNALSDAGHAGITDPAQLAIIEEEAQQYAQKLIQGETVGWEGVLDELANAPDNPAGLAAAFDLLSQVYELKRMARQEVDDLMQPIRAATTKAQKDAAWGAKFAGTRDIYTKLADDLQAVFEQNKDILRRIAAGEEVPKQRDWWDVINRYLDFDERANFQTRGQEFGDMMQEDPAIVQKFIDANRAYVDSSYIQLYDIFRRYPSLDALDILRMADRQLNAEGARAAAYLATQRARIKHFDDTIGGVVGDLDKEDYYVIRNETWRAMFDNQVIFNQAAARAIAAHALALDSPTKLTWTDEFFGGTFQLIGPAADDPITAAISLTVDDLFERKAFDPVTGKIADKYLAPKPLARVQGKVKPRWSITPVETETQFQALAVAGVTEKRTDGWYLLILDEDAAQQAVKERGKFAWLARNVETGQIQVFGSPNPQAPLAAGTGSNARVPGAVMDDFGAVVEGRPFAAAPEGTQVAPEVTAAPPSPATPPASAITPAPAPSPAPPQPAAPARITKEMRKKLYAMHYRKADVGEMTPAEAQRIIDSGKTKTGAIAKGGWKAALMDESPSTRTPTPQAAPPGQLPPGGAAGFPPEAPFTDTGRPGRPYTPPDEAAPPAPGPQPEPPAPAAPDVTVAPENVVPAAPAPANIPTVPQAVLDAKAVQGNPAAWEDAVTAEIEKATPVEARPDDVIPGGMTQQEWGDRKAEVDALRQADEAERSIAQEIVIDPDAVQPIADPAAFARNFGTDPQGRKLRIPSDAVQRIRNGEMRSTALFKPEMILDENGNPQVINEAGGVMGMGGTNISWKDPDGNTYTIWAMMDPNANLSYDELDVNTYGFYAMMTAPDGTLIDGSVAVYMPKARIPGGPSRAEMEQAFGAVGDSDIAPQPAPRPPVTVSVLNQLANGAGIATSKADGGPTHRHLINSINKSARDNNAGWQLPTRTIIDRNGKPIQVTTDADFRAWVTAQPAQAEQAAEWLAVKVENAAKLAAEPKAVAATKVAKTPKPKKGKAAAAPAPAPEPAFMPDVAQDVDFTQPLPAAPARQALPVQSLDELTPVESVTGPWPLPSKIQQRMGSEGNAYMEARRSLPPGGSGAGYAGEIAAPPVNPWAETLAPYARSVDEMKASGSVPAIMTRQMKTHLADLDYTQAEIGAMGPEDAWSALHDAYVQATTIPPRAPFVDTGKPGRARATPSPAAAPSPAGAPDAAIRREINLGGFYQDKATTNSVKIVPTIGFDRNNPLYNVETTSAAGIRRNLLDTPVSMQEAQDAAVRHAAAGFPETAQPAAAAPAPQAVAPSGRTVVTDEGVNRQTASAADLAADYKARGMPNYLAWDEFLKDRALRPEMNAKEFYALFDNAMPVMLRGKREAVAFTPTHRMQFEEGGPSQLVMVTQDPDGLTRTLTETGSKGSFPPGMPLPDYIKPLQAAAPAAPAPVAQPVTPAPAPAAQRSQALPTYVNEAGETVVVMPVVTPEEKAAKFVDGLRTKYNVEVDEARVLEWQKALEAADTRREEMMARRRALFDEKIKAKGRQEIDAIAEQIAALDLEMKPFDEAIIEAQGEITEIFRIADANKLHARWRAMSPRDRVLEELEYAVANRNTKSDRSLAAFNIPEAIKRIKDNPDLPVVELTVPVPGKTATDVLGKAEQDAIKANLKEAQALLSSNKASAVTINYGRWHITVLDPIQAQELAKGLGTRLSASVPTYSGITPSSGGFAGILEDSAKMAGFQNIEIWENAIPMQGRTMAPNTAILENVASRYKLGKPKSNTFAGDADGATWYSDGYAMFGVKPKDWNGATFDPLNNPKAHQELVTTAAKSDLPLEPLGLVNYDSIPVIALGTDDGKIKFINAKYYAGAMQAAGGKPVTWATASKKSQPIVAFVDGKPLSIIMPMAGDKTKIDQVAKYFYPTSDAGMLTLYGGLGAVDPIPAMTDIYNTLIRYWRKPKQPEIGDVALHQVTTLNDAEDRILAALPRMAQPKRNNLTAAQANALIDVIDKRLLPAFDDAVSRATYGAEQMANTAMLNYRDRRGIDANLALILPYHYFYTRGGATWLRRVARKPSTANMYYDLQKAIETENAQSGVPARFKGTIPLWSYPGGQIRMANPMNSMLPWYMYMPEPYQQQEGDSDAERMWTAIRSMTPGMMPVFDVAMAAAFDYLDPLPDGASRVARFTNTRNYFPIAGMFADAALATTGTVFPAWMGGDPYDPYRIKTAASFMAQEGAISAEIAKYVIQLSLNLQRPGTDAWANIPDDQAAAVSAAYMAAAQRAGRDKLGMGGGAGYFLGANVYNMPDAERELRSAQDLWRYVGYGEQNPSGSATQRQAVMAQTPALGAYMARTTQPGSPYQPGQQAQAGALYDQLDPLYAQQAAVEDKLITESGGGVSGETLYNATAQIRKEADALRAKYPDIPAPTGKPISGSNPAEMATWMIRQAVPKGGPTYPGEGASKAEMAAYYDARSAWEKEQLATFTRNLTTIMAGSDPMQDEINFELFQLTAGKDAATLLREYGAGYYDTPTKRAYDTRNDVKNRAESAKFDAAEALILQEFGPAGLDVYKTYAITEDADREAYKAAHPELRALNFAAYNPNEYAQAVALFGKDAIMQWAKLPPTDGSEEAAKVRSAYYDANPGAYLMNAWMNGRPTPYGETRGPWASLPPQWGMEYRSNYGKDFAEAAQKFGADIWQIVAGYKRGWSSKEKGAYFDKYPQLGDFFDWWNELLPDDGKGANKGWRSYKRYYKNYRKRYYSRRRSYGGYSRRSYGGYGGGGGWNDEPKPAYIPDVYGRDFDRNLWRTDSVLRRWEPARAGDNEAERWRPARYGRASGY